MTDRRQALQEAFTQRLRSVIMVDDQFPSFEEACAGQAPKKRETSRAIALWKGFRSMGMACEIENQPLPAAEHLKKADLVVLDYHLTGDHDDGGEARKLLRELVEDGRQHLVIVYTSDPEISKLRLMIAASVAGVPQAASAKMTDDDEDDYSEWKRESQYDIPEKAFIKYLQRDARWAGDCMRDFPQHRDKGQLKRFLERLAHSKAAAYGASSKVVLHRLNVSTDKPAWVRCDNMFVVIVRKGDEEITDDGVNGALYLRERLLDALADWNPSFLRVMLNYARHCIVEQGFVGDDKVLKSTESEAGWLLFMSSGTPEERQERVAALYGRLFEDLIIESLSQIEGFSERYDSGFGQEPAGEPSGEEQEDPTDPAVKGRRRIENARKRAGVGQEVKDESIVHGLNDFLAFEEKTPSFLRTGTVFVTLAANGKWNTSSSVWICTTPDCDLVPRQPKSGWGKRLYPYTPVLCRPVSWGADSGEALKSAEDARALFLKGNGALHVLDLLTHQRPEMIFVENSGRIDKDGKFNGRTVRFSGETSSVELERPQQFLVVGQLRARYAMRMLHEAGHYLSRIGVDFIDWPSRRG